MTSVCLLTLVCVLVATSGQQQGNTSYHGILINGRWGGTQLYDPFSAIHATGNLQLGLQTGDSAKWGAAVINGPLAYFNSGQAGIR